jgi:glucose/arabinose dehydrogenase
MTLRSTPLAAALGGILVLAAALPACAQQDARPFTATPLAQFAEPWAMTFLPDGRLLVTEKRGKLQLHDLKSAQHVEIDGVPQVAYGGQGGLGDVVLHPDFANNGQLYLSYAESNTRNQRGAAVARATLVLDANGGGALTDLKVIWRQHPKKSGQGHYGHRIAFAPDGHLFISSGERQEFTPAQDMEQNLGKVLRLKDDGSLPKDNPFAEQGGVAAQVWTLGHRNPLGIAFDAQGRLWEHEMGPRGGDELNLIERGKNYGYPVVSDGDHYDGREIPDHATRPEFERPKITWTPVVSPAGMVIYSGTAFPEWRGQLLMGGLSGQALLRIAIDGDRPAIAARYDMGQRIREVEQGPDGTVFLLEDGGKGSDGRLLQLTPAP